MALFPGGNAFLENIIFHPCARPWFVWIGSAGIAFIKAVVTVRIFDLEDLMRERAKNFAEGPARRTGRGVRHSILSFIDDDAGPRNTWSQKAVKHALTATVPLEYIGLTILVFGAADRFFYDWQALMLAYRFCEGDPDSGPFQRARGADNILVNAMLLPILEQNRSGWGNRPIDVDVPAGSFTILLMININYKGAGVGTWRAEIRATISGVVVTEDSPELALKAGQGGDMMAEAHFFFPFGGTISWNLRGDPVPVGLGSTGAKVIVMKSQF